VLEFPHKEDEEPGVVDGRGQLLAGVGEVGIQVGSVIVVVVLAVGDEGSPSSEEEDEER
jgi:hypothetical protein